MKHPAIPMKLLLFVFIFEILLYTAKSALPHDVAYNLRDIDQECFDEGSQFWGSFWLFTDEGQIYFEMYRENIYFQTIFPDRVWLGIGWNEDCQTCVVENNHDYKEVCIEECLNDNSFIVIGRHDLSISQGWGLIDVDANYNKTLANYTLYNQKNVPHSYYDQDIDFNNVIFFKPPDFDEFTTDNVWAQFQRYYAASPADEWSRMYEIEVDTPYMPTCITYISSYGTNEHSSISAKYTQTPEKVEYWDVVCINVTEYCLPPTPAPTWEYIPPIDVDPYCQGKNIELVLFLDTSWSILDDVSISWQYAKNFSADVISLAYDIVRNISYAETGDADTYTLKVSFITFAKEAELVYNLDEFGVNGISTQQELKDAQEMILNAELPNIHFRKQMQGTHVRDAIELYLDDVTPLSDALQAGICLIMITDGRPDDPLLQNPCRTPALGGPVKSDGAVFTLLTIGEMDDLSFFTCLMDDPDQQAIQLEAASDLYEITPLIENKLIALICGITNAVCDYPLYAAFMPNVQPFYPVQNKTIYDADDDILINTIEYEFTIRNSNSELLTTDSYNGVVWITEITIAIYYLHFCNADDFALTAYIIGINDINVAVISNLTEIDVVAGQYVYNIHLPVMNPFTDNEYYMRENHTYRLGIRIENLQDCDVDSDDPWPAIPCTEYPAAASVIGIQQDSFSSWYYFDNVSVYYGEDNIPTDEDVALCVPLVQLCLIEPLIIPSVGPTTQPTPEPTFRPTPNPTKRPVIDPTSDPTNQPTEIPTSDPTNAPTEGPTFSPTIDPTNEPTDDPTRYPLEPGQTHHPTPDPSNSPTVDPTQIPTNIPTIDVTDFPTFIPSPDPIEDTTADPTIPEQTENPTTYPTVLPTIDPTIYPTREPLEPGQTHNPTPDPTNTPTTDPTHYPTQQPSDNPTLDPTQIPTNNPSTTSSKPTNDPTTDPTRQPLEPGQTYSPTTDPTTQPTNIPTFIPSPDPIEDTTSDPTIDVSINPTMDPTYNPTIVEHTNNPTTDPTQQPLQPGQTHSPTNDPTNAPTNDPVPDTNTPTTDPTFDPITNDPTYSPTIDPTRYPLEPGQTHHPTPDPTNAPTIDPTIDPTNIPTIDVTDSPTFIPSPDPIEDTTADPTISGQIQEPTTYPTVLPTMDPTIYPTREPLEPGQTYSPTPDPTNTPTTDPREILSQNPTINPTNNPTHQPTDDTSINPTMDPTIYPTREPLEPGQTHDPTPDPSNTPTDDPTIYPTTSTTGGAVTSPPEPTFDPTLFPTREPLEPGQTHDPTVHTTQEPTDQPTPIPTRRPFISEPTTLHPTSDPIVSIDPTIYPTTQPIIISLNPTMDPIQITMDPTNQPSNNPTIYPTNEPSINPTENPTISPTDIPTHDPTDNPTNMPSEQPTEYPSYNPSEMPTENPTNEPTQDPTPCKPETSTTAPPQRSWWSSNHYDYDDDDDDDAHPQPQYIPNNDATKVTVTCPKEQPLPDGWRCKRECFDIRSTEWNVELAGITQNIDDGSSAWTYRIQISELYLPDNYNHWCGFYEDFGDSFIPKLAEINKFYIGISGCCDISNIDIAYATSFRLSHPRIDDIDNGWIWEDLRIKHNTHFAEFTLVFPHNIFAPIHGEFWILSDHEQRCVRGGTLIPDLCHFSNDYTMSGMLNLIVVVHNDWFTHDPCESLISYFNYDNNIAKCKSYPYPYDNTRRQLRSDDEGDEEIEVVFNFTMTFNNDTIYAECIQNLQDANFADLFIHHYKKKTNLTVVNVSVVDLQYDTNVVNVNDEIPMDVVEEDGNMNKTTGIEREFDIMWVVVFCCMSVCIVMAGYVCMMNVSRNKNKDSLEYGEKYIREEEVVNNIDDCF